MKTVKRITAVVLCIMFVISSFPAGVISFGGSDDNGNTMSIGYYNGMTLEELVETINKAAGLDKDTPIEEWSWYTNGIADYDYGRYLIDIKYEEFDLDYENVNVIRGLEIYDMYLKGEISKEELEQNYSDVDMMFNDINIDSEKLKATVEDALDAAQREFRRGSKYVPFAGESVVVKGKLVELDPDTDPHCAYDVTIDVGVTEIEQTLYFPTRLELNGTESYPSILTAVSNGETINVKHGSDVYTIKVYGISRSEIVLTGKQDYVYPISFNVAAGDKETDILDRIYDTVVDFESSTLADDFDINEKNGFTVRFYDKKTGWYEFDAEQQGRLEAGLVYDIEMIYEGETTDTVEFQIALYDPRINPSIAIYGDEKLVVEYTGNVEDIKQAVFEALIDKSDLPNNVKYSDFDYYYLFEGFASFSNELSGNSYIDKKFEEFRQEFYDGIWATVESNMGDHPVFDKISKEEFKEKYFTKEKLIELLSEERYISFDGGYYPITMDVEGTEVVLFELNFPKVYAAVDHKIKVVYNGNDEYTSAEAESVEKVLQISALTSDLDVVDGCYQVGSDVKKDMLVQSYDLDYFVVTFEIDTDYLEITNIYIDFPEASNEILTVRFANGNEENICDYLKKYLARENYNLSDLLDFLANFENSEFSSGTLLRAVTSLERLFEKLPESAESAQINYNGIPEKKEGVYFVAAATADLNAVSNSFDYGICFIVSQLERDYFIIYSNEIPEEGFSEYPDFDFSAFVFDMNFEPYEENPMADSIFIGYEQESDKIILSYDVPMTKGQYIQISKSPVANPISRYFDIGLGSVIIESPGDVFEFDGLVHGEPLIYDYFGNEIELNDSDTVIYTNTITNKSSYTAPYKVGNYSVTVIFAGREDYAPLTASYSFKIVPKTVDLWVEDAEMIYGDKLPEFTVGCSDESILSEIQYTVAPNVSYDGSVGVYGLIINVKSLPEGYVVNKLGGELTVNPRPIKIEMNDITIEYGTDYHPNSEGYFTVVEGEIVNGDNLGLEFEKFSNAGVYTFAPVDYTNKNYDLTFESGTITIEKRKLTLTIKNAFMYEGDELPEFSFIEQCPEDLDIHIAPSYFTGEPGEYLLIGYNDNPNYDVTIHDGTLFVNPKPPKKVQVYTPDYSITYGEELPEFEVITSEELEGVEFTVVVAGSYNGDVGTYPLTILSTGVGENNYAFEFVPGKLTVCKKDITVKIDDYTGTYGDVFDPENEYTVSCDDEKVDLSEITFEIGAENYNGEAGSYLFIGKGISRNYNVTVETGTLTINPKLIQVIPVEGQGKTEGELDGEIDYIVNGLIGKDTLDGLLSREEGEDVGLYEILLGTLNNKNYEIQLDKVLYAIRSKDYLGIRIDRMPENLVYLEGTELNLDGLKVTAIGVDGSETELVEGEYTVLGFNKDEVGTQRLSVYYKGHMVGFDILVTPTEVLNIKIDKLPSKLIYIEGQEFNSEGMTAVVFFDNGTYMYIDPQYLNFSGFDKYRIGTQTVTAEYGGKTDSFEVTVVPKDVAGIEIDTTDVKTEFVAGNDFDSTGLKVYLVYNNGTKILLSSGYTVTGYSKNTIGTQHITVAYGDFEAYYDVNVIKKTVEKLDVSFDGEELIVVKGNAFDPKQLTVVATFNDGSTKKISYGEYKLTGYNGNAIGIWNATIEYGGYTSEVLVRVVAFSIVKIEVTQLPNNTVFFAGEENNIDGIGVTVYYNNNTSEAAKGFEVYGYEADKLGIQTLTVSYLGYKTEYFVTVVPEGFEGIEIGKLPYDTEYIENTAYDFDGIEVYMICGSERMPIDFTDLEFSVCDTTKVGVQTIVVSYAGKSAEFEITIVEKQVVKIAPVVDEDLVCIIDSAPITEGVYIKVEYDNGEFENVEITAEMIGEFDNQTKGKQSTTITYGGVYADVDIWVVAGEVVEIIISSYPTWIEFTENMEFTAEGLEVIVRYADGSFDLVYPEDCEIYGYDMSNIGIQNVTVEYANKSVTYDITVSKKKLSHVEIYTMPEKLEYISGEALELAGIVLKVYYDNGEFYFVDDVSRVSVVGYNPAKIGEQTVYVTIFNMTAEYTVTVYPIAPVGISLDLSATRLGYYIHNVLSAEGLKVYLNYNNGDSHEVSVNDCTIEGYDPFVLGEQTITVKYNEFVTEYTITVIEGAPISIDVDETNMSLDTVVGTAHSFDKLIVKALYPDGTYSNLVYGAYTVEDYDYTVYGVYNAKIVYSGLSENITLTVLPEFTLEFATEGKGPVYTVNDIGLIIDNVGVTTTVYQLKKALAGGEYIVVTDKNGEVLEEDAYVGTGAKISFAYNGETYGNYDVVVRGDVNGDGVLSITDAVMVGHAIADIYEFEPLYEHAADVVGNNGFTITDVIAIKQTVSQ